MARILTGIQSTGTPHLGNILGAILPAIDMSKNVDNDSFLFIADMHSLTQIKDSNVLRNNTYSTAATWLAFGLDIEKTVFYRQSDIPQVTELAWYLSCFFPYQRLTLAHSFKDKADRLEDVNAGLFTYPMLMAADILLYDANIIPVGKDQLQHIEMTRDVASRFHAKMGDTFVIPDADVQEQTMLIPGTDGEKMSKSKGNSIPLFESPKKLRKVVMGIKTTSEGLDDPKSVEGSTVYDLYALLVPELAPEMKRKLEAGGYGWGHAKEDLFEAIEAELGPKREAYLSIRADEARLDALLHAGAGKARDIARHTMGRVRSAVGID